MTKKKKNSMQKIGQGIKETFMEMSESLAGWIDDASGELSKPQPKRQNKKTPSKQPTRQHSQKQTTETSSNN